MRKTEIIATIGNNPIWDNEMIRQASEQGVNVFRLSSAHNHDPIFFNTVRKYAPKAKILQDINEGVKKRILTTQDITVHKNTNISISFNKENPSNAPIHIDWDGLQKKVLIDNIIYVGDGEVAMKVISVDKDKIICTVLNNGVILKGKALNINGIESGIKAINNYNRNSIIAGAKFGYDIVAISFVSSAEDIKDYWEVIHSLDFKYTPFVIAKIETALGVSNIDEILDKVDGIMIARGDLALQVDFKLLGIIQRNLILKCRKKNKYCIVATQMLESIINRYIPSRAEILDITNAVYYGANAVMLSPESCINPNPLGAINTMREIIENVELDISSSF